VAFAAFLFNFRFINRLVRAAFTSIGLAFGLQSISGVGFSRPRPRRRLGARGADRISGSSRTLEGTTFEDEDDLVALALLLTSPDTGRCSWEEFW
jgi:hypothetical protein